MDNRDKIVILGADGKPLPPYVPEPQYMVECYIYETIGIIDPYLAVESIEPPSVCQRGGRAM